MSTTVMQSQGGARLLTTSMGSLMALCDKSVSQDKSKEKCSVATNAGMA